MDQITRVDVRLTKVFPIKERYQAMFTFDAFNVANHPYYTSVSTREYTYSLVNNVPTLNPGYRVRCRHRDPGLPGRHECPAPPDRCTVYLLTASSIHTSLSRNGRDDPAIPVF